VQSALVTINNVTVPTAPSIGTVTQPTCENPTGSVVLNGLPAGNWTVTRAPGGATINGSGSSLTISGLASNTYTFRVTNAAGCQSSPSAGVTIIASPTAPAAFTLTGSSICSSAPGTGTARLSSSQNGVSYQLKNGSNSNVQAAKFGNGSSITWTGLSAGNGYYVVGSRSGCTVNSNTANVSTIAAPAATIVYRGSPYCRFSFGIGTVTRTGQAGGTYTASPAGLSLNATTGAINLLFSQAGTYTVTYTVSNGTCTTKATASVRINSCFGNNNATTSTGTVNQKLAGVTQQLAVKIRPIPTETYFTLNVSTPVNQTPVEINVYDVTGRKIQQLRGSAFDTYRFGDNYTVGAYLIEVVQDGQRVTQKVLKQ
jgi:hypothetical protein